jgi:hypothetical protein
VNSEGLLWEDKGLTVNTDSEGLLGGAVTVNTDSKGLLCGAVTVNTGSEGLLG